jgi:hypothetical protein
MYKLMPSCFDLINKINVIGLMGGCGRGGIILIMSLKRIKKCCFLEQYFNF